MRATRQLRTNERQRYMLGMGQVLEREAGMILIAFRDFMISSTFVLGEHYRLYGRVEKVSQEVSHERARWIIGVSFRCTNPGVGVAQQAGQIKFSFFVCDVPDVPSQNP